MDFLLRLPRPLLAVGLAAIVLGVPFGLQVLFTMRQRRIRRELRRAAEAHGWRYTRRWWQGNPIAFRIDGQTSTGLPWKLTCGNRSYNGPGWSTEMVMRFPTLGGETDVGIAPRDAQGKHSEMASTAGFNGVDERISAVSQTLSGAVRFMGSAREVASGDAEFDALYEVAMAPELADRPLVDAALAEKILRWPADTLKVHSVVAWRDPFGFVLEARLPGSPDWATVAYFLQLGDELVQRLPAAKIPATATTGLDRMIGRMLR